jgi:RNA polymerase sigma factor (sigma-70 family)
MDFDALYRAERSVLEFYIMACGGNHDEASDAVQAAFVLLLQARKPIQEPRSWLRKVALNEFRRSCPRIRSRRRRVTEAPTAPDELPDREEVPSAADVAEGNERRRLATEMIASLPRKQRDVMALHYDGLLPGEIADLLGLGAAAVRQSFHRARKTLRKEYGIDHGECLPLS